MELHPSWIDVALRLFFTIAACLAIGWNRIERGHAAGPRTTVLVGLAAAVAMVQANLLLGLEGKTASSFGTADVMRLPLGILTGVGFIGGGAILKRGELVTGLTTAATLWIATILGLCFGAGEIALGTAASLIALAALWSMRWFEAHVGRSHRALMTILLSGTEIPDDLEAALRARGFKLKADKRRFNIADKSTRATYLLTWTGSEGFDPTGDLAHAIAGSDRVCAYELQFLSHH